LVGPLVLVTQIFCAWTSVCLLSRRLHDAGHSGWLQAPPTLVVIAGIALLEPAWAEALGLSDGLVTAIGWGVPVLYVGLLVVVGLLPSTGPNRFDRSTAAPA
jgi:uncharacterized membrane protein YhaH (DUF805 family)